MSDNSKKIVGGVLALVAIVSLVNTSAIINLTNVVRSQGQTQRVAYMPTQSTAPMQEYYVGNQQAALGTLGAEVVEDEFGGGFDFTYHEHIFRLCYELYSHKY